MRMYTTLDDPLATFGTYTVAAGINDNGQIVVGGIVSAFVPCSPIKSSAEWEGAASEPCRVSNVR
jgi:uncharacterized membrane protein